MFNGRRQPSCGGTSRMTQECHVRFCERLGVQFPGPSRQTRPRGHVGSMSGLPKSGHDWAITRPTLTPLADLGRSAGQAPLHGLHALGIAAADDDAEIAA